MADLHLVQVRLEGVRSLLDDPKLCVDDREAMEELSVELQEAIRKLEDDGPWRQVTVDGGRP
jgi:hypothetical protein